MEDSPSIIIIGAGIAGLSSLAAANEYLAKNEYALIVDIRPNYGGNWLDQYDYVRMHQPYKQFTAYDEPWLLEKPSEYLATKSEVIQHLQHIGRKAEKEYGTKSLFQHQYVGYETVSGSIELKVDFRSTLNSDNITSIYTRKLVIATGMDVKVHKPLQITSSRVQSIAPVDLVDVVQRKNTIAKPSFIITGSGKTAMDTIIYIHNKIPGAEILVIEGKYGMAFTNREFLFPSSGKAFKGRGLFEHLSKIGLSWNGSNSKEVLHGLIQKGQAFAPFSDPSHTNFALLSKNELDIVKKSVNTNIRGRLIDIIDDIQSSEYAEIQVEDAENYQFKLSDDQTFVINCKGHVRLVDVYPIFQEDFRVLRPQIALGFPGPTANMLTHVWFQGKAKEAVSDLYQVQFYSEDKTSLFTKAALALAHNGNSVTNHVPIKVLFADKSNFQTWFPFHRILWDTFQLKKRTNLLKRKTKNLLGDTKYPLSS